MDNKKLLYIILGLITYIVSTVSAYAFFSQNKQFAQQNGSSTATSTVQKKAGALDALTFNTDAPKTQACPLNGVLYSKDQESWWLKHRPLGVMIENHEDARPQSGISSADVTYEAVAEGGITRTLNIFYCQDAGIIGPVRSARTYFLDFVSEYGDYPLYAHVGGANTPGPADALGQIDTYGWGQYNDLNQFSIGYPTYWRDETRQGHAVATEHTMYSTTSKLWAVGAQRSLTNVDKNGKSWDTNFVKYSFKDDASVALRPMNQSIHVEFMGAYDAYLVDWNYDKASNSYLRTNGGKPHIDRDTGKQLAAKDIIILHMREGQANDGYENNLHMLYGTTGVGKAEIFMDGKQMLGTWKKASRTSRLQIYDTTGNEVQFNRGHLWFQVISTLSQVGVK